jgi:cytochrome P450
MATPAPGPGRLGAGLMYAKARDPFTFLENCVAKYGDMYTLPLGPGGTTVVNDPELVGSWLSDYKRYHKGVMSRALVPALGESIPVSDGEPWQRNRKALNPAFGRKNLDGLAGIISGAFIDGMERFERLADSGEEVDVYRELGIMAMMALQRSMFSSSVSDHDVPQLIDDFRTQTTYMGGLMMMFWAPSWMPIPGSKKGVPAVEAIRKRIKAAIDHRRRTPTDDSDVLNMMLATTYEDGTPLSDEELMDELMGIWFGGFDTTASALVWTLGLVSQHPGTAARLQAEADAFTGDFQSYGELNDLPYAKAAFDEAQRLQGALLLTRQALEDDEIGGFSIPKGSQVGVSAYTMNRHPGVWDNPERYDPDRWLDDRKEEQHRWQWVQFGGGPRHCIGMGMAYLEAQFFLAMFAKRFRLEIQPGFELRHDFHLSVGIKGGLPARVRRRKEAPVHA